MNSRERIAAALSHRPSDVLPCDFGGGFQTGIAVSLVYALRQRLGLDPPGAPVKVVEVYQMLGEIKPDLGDWIGSDTVPLYGTGTMFGYPAVEFKEWRLEDGTPVLVPVDFNTAYEENGDLLQYPGGDKTVPASGRMPAGGHFFDAIIRQEPLDEAHLDFRDNCEEFEPVPGSEIEHFRLEADRLYGKTERALFCSFGGLTFGDIALVPGVSLKKPRGIRDIESWYVSLLTRPADIERIFSRQAEVAIGNLEKLHEAVGGKIAVIQTNGTDFGTQNGPLCSPRLYRKLFLPYQQMINGWIHARTGWKTFMHCCGGIEPLLPDIIEAGFDILNPVQCSAAGMDPALLKTKYGDRVVFWGGGVDTQKTLPFGTPDQVRREVEERIRIFGAGGGFVFNAIHNIVAGTPLENLMAMFETVKKFRSGAEG
jgi:hypothetical protein